MKEVQFMLDELRLMVVVNEKWLNQHPSYRSSRKVGGHRIQVTRRLQRLVRNTASEFKRAVLRIDPTLKVKKL